MHNIQNEVILCYLLSKHEHLLLSAMALKFLRDKGISHMDLKPQNLLISGRDKNSILKVAGELLHIKKRDLLDASFYWYTSTVYHTKLIHSPLMMLITIMGNVPWKKSIVTLKILIKLLNH